MFSLFRRVLGLPTGLEHALLLLKAQNTHLVAHVTAAVAFLTAAESGAFELVREQNQSSQSTDNSIVQLCGTRLSGSQDDLLRFANYTFLAKEFEADLTPLSKRINVTPGVLRRALEKYEKLEGQLLHRGSQEVVRTLALWIRQAVIPSMEQKNDMLTRVREDCPQCVGAELASLFVSVLPSNVAIELPGSGLYQLGTGVQLKLRLQNIAIPPAAILLLLRATPWMQKGRLDTVDAECRFCSPVDLVETAKPPPVYGVFSDSTVLPAGNFNARHAIISRVRSGVST